MSTEHDEITTLLRRAADEYPVDADALWARTRDRVDAATSGNARTGPATRRRVAVMGAVAATAVIAGSAVAIQAAGNDRKSGAPAEQGSAKPSPTSLPKTALGDDVLRLHGVPLPPSQRHVDVTVPEDKQHSERYAGPTAGFGPATEEGHAGALVLAPGTYRRFDKPYGSFLSLSFVPKDHSVESVVREGFDTVHWATSAIAGDPITGYSWSYDAPPAADQFDGRLVLTSAAGPEIAKWVARFTDGSTATAQRLTVPGSDDGFFILVGPHLADVKGKLKDVEWIGADGTVRYRSNGGGGLP